MRLVTESIASLRPYEAGKPLDELAREFGVTDAIKLASNENPFGPSPKGISAARAVLGESHRYPDAAQYQLKQKLSDIYGVQPADIVLGSGSNELLDLLVRTFCTSSEHLVFAEPSFVVYKMAALAHGVPFTAVPLKDQRHDLAAMASAVRPNTRIVFIANPNNPTGTYVSTSELRQFLAALPEHVIVALDEAYIEYADTPDFPDGLMLRGDHPNLVVLRTFSKIYGLAALRVGYAFARSELIHPLNCVRAPFNVSTAAQAAAIAALDDIEHLEASRALNQSERARLTTSLAALGLSVVPSQANFLLIQFGRAAAPIYDALLRRGVIVRPLAVLPECLRVTVGLPQENDRFLAALAEVLR